MGIGALIIGDEIVSGKRQDKHLSRAIATLGERGLALDWAHYLGDDPARITAFLAHTFATSDIVFSFGGIGHTPDDYTRQCAAAALGRELRAHPEGLAELEARFGKGNYGTRIGMVEFPEGASIIPNPFNRIPGFRVNDHHFLPGFPEMAWPMMAWTLDTQYAGLPRVQPEVEEAIVVAAGESALLEVMRAVVRHWPALKLSSLPRNLEGGYEVELAVRGDLAGVKDAMAFVRAEVARLGHAFTERAPLGG